MQQLVERAVNWHRNSLPPHENIASFVMHVAGPKLHGDVVNPARFHTYACLYPELGRYVAMNTSEWDDYPDCTISAAELREVIADLAIPSEKIEQQRKVAAQFFGSSATTWFRWHAALQLCATVQLPVGMLMVGTTAATSERVVYMQTMALAPLVKVANAFKEAAPQVDF